MDKQQLQMQMQITKCTQVPVPLRLAKLKASCKNGRLTLFALNASYKELENLFVVYSVGASLIYEQWWVPVSIEFASFCRANALAPVIDFDLIKPLDARGEKVSKKERNKMDSRRIRCLSGAR